MSQEVQYVAVQPVGGAVAFNGSRIFKWVAGSIVATLVLIGALVTWSWVDGHIFGIGIENAGHTTVDEAQLLDRVRTFELVTTRDTYDTRSNTDFHKRLNLGIKKFNLPGFVAGEELDVKAQVTVAAGVDLSAIQPEDIEVIQQGESAVVVVHIPAAQLMGTEIDGDTFDISTSQGLFDRIGSSIGLGGRDVRDGAVEAVTSIAQEEAVRGGLLTEASVAAREQLQQFLQGLPQGEGQQVIYLVDFQVPPAQ
jgi:hypothetical protein